MSLFLSSKHSRPIIVLGVGGHAKVVADALQKSGNTILGFLSPDLGASSSFCGHKILGNDDVISQYSHENILLANGIGALPKQNLRWQLATQMRAIGYTFVSVIHPSSIIAGDVALAEGVQIMAGAVLQAGVTVGKDSLINTRASVDHDCHIAQNCHLAPGVVCSGGVSIGENTHLGTSSSVIQNIVIGQHCIIAAGSVIYRNIADDTTVIQAKKMHQE